MPSALIIVSLVLGAELSQPGRAVAAGAPARELVSPGAVAKAPPMDVFACHQSPGQSGYSCWDRAGRLLGHAFKDLATAFPHIPSSEHPQLLANFEQGCIPSNGLPLCATTRFILEPRVVKGQTICKNILGTRFWWRADGSQFVLKTQRHQGNFHGESWSLNSSPANLAHLQAKSHPNLRCRDGTAVGDDLRAWSLRLQRTADAISIDESSVASPTHRAGGVDRRGQFLKFMKRFNCSAP